MRALRNNSLKRTIALQNDKHELITKPVEIANLLAQEYSRRSSGITSDPIFQAHKSQIENNELTFQISEPR